MDDNQLLQAMSQMMDEKLADIKSTMVTKQTLENQISNIEGNMITKQELDENKKSILRSIDSKIDSLREEMTRQNNETRMLVENGYSRIENLLREDYGRIADAANKVQDYDELKNTVAVHEDALQNHNKRITELENKAAI